MIGEADATNSVAAASNEVALAVMRVGFGLMAAAAASDALFAALAGAGFTTLVLGVVFTGCAMFGLARPDFVARLLRRKGCGLVPAALFAVIGALDPGVQANYSEVAPAIVWIAVITSSTGLVAWCVVVSAAGYVADLEVQGRSLDWMLHGPGQGLLANQTVDLAANAGVMLFLITVLRRFVRGAPQRIADVRSGGLSLTPQLALAAREELRALPRADSRALGAQLTPSECKVIELLIAGRAPKQAAGDLDVKLTTIRTHIASAKRKCGARTVEQLAASYVESQIDE